MGDVQEHVIGNQPLGSLGAEDVVREFTQAFCALPAKPFKDMGGVKLQNGVLVGNAGSNHFAAP